jgi:UDP-3-O-[3-hydroxymyristoyl] glucosamine N-acyltransferase
VAKEFPGWTLAEIAAQVNGVLHGDPGVRVSKPVPAGSADPLGFTFAGNDEFLAKAAVQGIGVVLAKTLPPAYLGNVIVVENPRSAFGALAAQVEAAIPLQTGVHPSAVIDPTATMHETASIGPNAVIGRNAIIEANVIVGPLCSIGPDCHIGEGCKLRARATLVRNVVLGQNCIVHSGAVLGADGFGFEWDGQRHVKIPQLGRVIIGDDCEIGANTCIDRGALEDTVIGKGTKIDNLCQIGHNVKIGENCIIAGTVGIGGSAILGNRVTAGAAVGISDHAEIADEVTLGGRSGVVGKVKESGVYAGFPLQKYKDALRTLSAMSQVPDLIRRVRKLEQKAADEE